MTKQNGKWVYAWTPKTPDQEEAVQAFEENDLLFFVGGPGVGKTITALALGLQEVYVGRKKRVIYVRPIVEAAGENLGFLPGSVDEKIAPYLLPLHELLPKMSFHHPADVIEPRALAFLRGVTFEDCVVILSEAQNVTLGQFRLFLSRMGKTSKVIVEGDPDQIDLPFDRPSGFLDVVDRLEDMKGVGVIEFETRYCLRHPLVARMARRLA